MEPTIEVRGDPERQTRIPERGQGGGDVGEASPGLGAAEMIPEFVEGAIQVGEVGQDVGDDPPPPTPFDSLVGRHRAELLVGLVVPEVEAESSLDLGLVHNEPLAEGGRRVGGRDRGDG